MAMDFWEAQRSARVQTMIYLAAFALMVGMVAILAEVALRIGLPDYQRYPYPLIGLIFVGITVAVAFFNYFIVGKLGGGYVARSLGAKYVDPETCEDLRERQLLNIVEEMALAASMPIPSVYVLEAKGINAFAAGLTPDKAAITVTRGALMALTRDELQGVVGHEMGHIRNGDMHMSMILAVMITGFFVILYVGLRIIQFAPRNVSIGKNKKGGNSILLIAMVFMAAGALSWLAGTILRACVSRQREYLADASAAQFTRQTDGLIGALKKIEQEQIQDMPTTGGAYAHLYLDNRSSFDSLFASHPPLQKRIEALEGIPKE